MGDGTKFTETTIDLPTAEQEAARKKIQAEIDDLTAKMTAETPALERSQVIWEQVMRSEPSLRWQALVPEKLSASAGVTLAHGRDHAITASGPNPGTVVYTVESTTTLPVVTAVRLEALPDPALPKGGPGRDVYGNFQVNGLDIEAEPVAVKTSGFAPVGFKAIKSDDGGASMDSFFPKNLSRDAYAPRGWRIDASREETRLPRQAVFSLDRPLRNPAGTRLRIRLNHQQTLVGQALGRFRLSVTSSSVPLRVVEIPAKLRPILAIAPAERSQPQAQDLRTVYRNVGSALKPVRERIAALQKELKSLDIPTAMVMRERKNYERPFAFVRRRGSFLDKGEKVYADVPATLHALGTDQMPNRLGLARWLVDDRNPLTARVAVNRAWEQLFGRGIVETSEDFGTQGTPPSHRELLDWLATEFVKRGWRMKALHKLIVSSATYRQSSVAAASLVDRDPYNRLLARGPRFRLEAEMIRDSALAVSGLLSRKIGGPSVFPPQPEGIWDIPYSDEKWMGSVGDDRYRRGLYTFIRRSAAYPSFMTFDATSREFCTVRRVRTNTPLQALTTLNDEAFFEAARALAGRVLREAEASDNGRAIYGFRLVVSRAPATGEVERVVKSFNDNLTRFRSDPRAAAAVIKGYAVPGIDPAQQAAWTLVANALLNLDEALTKE